MPHLSQAARAAIRESRASAAEIAAEWRSGAAYHVVDQALGSAELPVEAVAARAEALLGDASWLLALLEPFVQALARAPYFESPFRVSRSALRTSATLFDSPAVTLAACVTNAAALRAQGDPRSIIFSGRISITRYIRAGGAILQCWRAPRLEANAAIAAGRACTKASSCPLTDGMVVRIDGRTQAGVAIGAASDIVTLVATLKTGADPLLREYGTHDQKLRRIASGDDRPSRAEMLLTLLRVAGRTDAGAAFDAASRDRVHQLRWAAMREWLALDAGAALPRLVEMAGHDPHPEVRAAAAATLARAQPCEPVPCPV